MMSNNSLTVFQPITQNQTNVGGGGNIQSINLVTNLGSNNQALYGPFGSRGWPFASNNQAYLFQPITQNQASLGEGGNQQTLNLYNNLGSNNQAYLGGPYYNQFGGFGGPSYNTANIFQPINQDQTSLGQGGNRQAINLFNNLGSNNQAYYGYPYSGFGSPFASNNSATITQPVSQSQANLDQSGYNQQTTNVANNLGSNNGVYPVVYAQPATTVAPVQQPVAQYPTATSAPYYPVQQQPQYYTVPQVSNNVATITQPITQAQDSSLFSGYNQQYVNAFNNLGSYNAA